MTRRSTRLALVLVVLTALAVSTTACSPASRTSSTDGSAVTAGTPSLVATSAGDPAQLPTGTVTGGTTAAGGRTDVKAIDAELNAMQKELDSISMPADSDFAPVEGALY